ncbi:MAG: hypothetical protein ACREVR_00685 [Burkholderiales bacterium]
MAPFVARQRGILTSVHLAHARAVVDRLDPVAVGVDEKGGEVRRVIYCFASN